jgi:hypothetical protein
MKKLKFLIPFIFFFTLAFSNYTELFALVYPREKVVTYRIGRIDPGFNLSKEEAISYASSSAFIWNSGLGKNIFKYDEKGKVVINFVFDKRQKETIEKNILKEKARVEEEDLKNSSSTLKIEKDKINLTKNSYEESVKLFEARVTSFNATVTAINTRGGAYPDEANKLKEEELNIKKDKDELELKRTDLNNLLTSFNKKLKTTI